MNKLNQKNKLNRQQLAFGALELAAWVLQNYQQFAPKEIEKLGKIFNLFVKIIAKSSQNQKQLFFAHDADTDLLPSQANAAVAPLEDLISRAERALRENDKIVLDSLIRQCVDEYKELEGRGSERLKQRIRAELKRRLDHLIDRHRNMP